MLGFSDTGAWLAYVSTIGAAVACIVYGLVNWNKPNSTEEAKEVQEELEWEKKEH